MDFVAWCRVRRLSPLPAHPWTLAAYARWCETRHRYPGVVKRVQAIARAHLLRGSKAPDRHPVVARTLRLIEMRERARPHCSALFADAEQGRCTTKSAKHTAAAMPRRRTLRSSPPLISKRPQDDRL